MALSSLLCKLASGLDKPLPKMITINGHPINHYTSPKLGKFEALRIGFPKLVKPAANAPTAVKGLNITYIKWNPDYPVDRGVLSNLVIQTCEFERVVLFDNNQNKAPVLFKCKSMEDEKTVQFVEVMKRLDDKFMSCISSDGVNYPQKLGTVSERYKPILKEDEYGGRTSFEIRAEIAFGPNGTPRDTMLYEMREDGPVNITYAEFLEGYKYRPCIAILEFPYMTVLNSGKKTVSVKPVVKQLLLLPSTTGGGRDGVQDNDTFKFMEM